MSSVGKATAAGSSQMQQQCVKHVFEGAQAGCATCGGQFCDECLVYAFGPKKPPLCIQCAVAAAGIRASAGTKRGTSALRRFRFPRARKPALETPSPLWPQVRLSTNA
jgi:hypothetical protein